MYLTQFKYFMLHEYLFFSIDLVVTYILQKWFDTDILNINWGLLKLRYPSECAAMLSLTNWKCIFLSRDIFALIYYCFLCGTYALLLSTTHYRYKSLQINKVLNGFHIYFYCHQNGNMRLNIFYRGLSFAEPRSSNW